MKELIQDLCKTFKGNTSSINVISVAPGMTLGTFNTKLSSDEANKIGDRKMCFVKESLSGVEEWVVYVLDSKREFIELYQTAPDHTFSKLIMEARLVNPNEPITFLIQREAPGLLIGFAATPIQEDGVRIEVNLLGRLSGKLN